MIYIHYKHYKRYSLIQLINIRIHNVCKPYLLDLVYISKSSGNWKIYSDITIRQFYIQIISDKHILDNMKFGT
jgi:hypothetical protein